MNDHPTEFSDELVAQHAKQIWEEEGRPEGKAEEHWFRAIEKLHQKQVEVAAAAAAAVIPPSAVGLS